MTWYQSITFLEVLFGGLFLLLYGLYILRIKRLAAQFGQRANAIWIKFGIRSFYFGLLILAILGPSFGAMKKEIRTVGKDILIAVDVSRSMDAPDVPPSRLGQVKHTLGKLIQRFNSDRIGLIIFSSEAFLHCPLTYDQSALQLYAQTLHTGLIPQSGTEFKPALDLALEKVSRLQPQDESRAKVILLISDGENFGEQVAGSLRRLQAENVKLYALGVGSPQGERIPGATGFIKDQKGQEVITRLSAENLRDLVREGNGSYFEITETANETDKLISAINSIEGEVRQSRTIDISANKYFYPLLLALLLIALDVLLTVQVIRL
jgi:Ca-activated chloride channel homolog